MTNATSTVVLAVDSSQVKSASTALDGFAASGVKAETAATSLEKTTRRTATATREVAAAVRDAATAQGALGSEAAKAATALKNQERDAKKASDAIAATAKQQAREVENAGRIAAQAARKQTNIAAQQNTQLGFQLQDFFIQLQAGQNPITAFVQQGSQLSGVYGGAGNALKAVTGLLTPLRLAFGGAAAAAGVLLLATQQVASEQAAYSSAIVGTGGAVGKSKGQLQDYAREISKTAGTTGAAADAIAQLASTGQVTGSSLVEAATVAVRAQKLIGREVGETVKAYAALGKDPIQALLALNEGSNFVTAALLKQVSAYRSLGNDSAAAALAQKAYSDQQKRVLDDAERNLGTLERGLNAAKGAAKGFWDAIVGLGRPETLESQLEAANKALATAPRRGGNEIVNGQRREGITENRDNLTRSFLARDNAQASAAVALKEQQDALDEQGSSRQSSRAAAARAGASVELANVIAGLDRQRNAALLAFQRDESDAAAHQAKLLKIDEAAINAQIANINRVTGIESSKRTGSIDEVLAKEATLLGLSEQRVQQGQRLADLRAQEARGARDIAPKSRSLGGRDALLGFKAQDEANVTAFLRQQTESITAADLALRQARESAQLYLDTLTQAQQREVDGLGKGAEVRSRDKGREQITDRYDQQRQQLDAQRRAGQLDKAHYDAELSVIKDFQSKALASYEDFYSARQKKEQDFAVGASDALADYLAASRNSAKQAEDAFSNAFKGAEDAIVQFALTGKISVKSMVQSIIADLLRIQVKRAVAGGLEGLLGMLGAFGGAGAGIGTNNTGGQLPTAGGRAIGGPVSRGGMYQVLEKGKPEMLTSGGKSYLMTGAQGGQVTPAQASDAAPVINVNIAGDATPQTARLVATLVQQALMRERRQRAYAGA